MLLASLGLVLGLLGFQKDPEHDLGNVLGHCLVNFEAFLWLFLRTFWAFSGILAKIFSRCGLFWAILGILG